MNKVNQYLPKINSLSQAKGIPPELATAVITHESGGNANAKNKSSSAAGLGQITDAAWKDAGYTKDDSKFDADKNLDATTTILARLWKKYNGDKRKVLLAYNQGEGGANAILSGKAKPETVQAGNAYVNSPHFKNLLNDNTANPVAGLPQRQGSLSGEELLKAKPQTQQEAVANEAGQAGMIPQDQQDLYNYDTTQYQLSGADQVAQNRQSDAEKEEYRRQQKAQLYAMGAMGLASLLQPGQSKDTEQTVSGEGAGSRTGYNWSTPTQQALRGLRSFNSYQ